MSCYAAPDGTAVDRSHQGYLMDHTAVPDFAIGAPAIDTSGGCFDAILHYPVGGCAFRSADAYQDHGGYAGGGPNQVVSQTKSLLALNAATVRNRCDADLYTGEPGDPEGYPKG
jgi:hypothetical protein